MLVLCKKKIQIGRKECNVSALNSAGKPVPARFLSANGLKSGPGFFSQFITGAVMTPALDLLKKVRAEHRVHSYEHDPKAASYGLEAAEKLNLEPAQVFKTLLASSEKSELLVAVVPVVGSLDLKALAQAAGVKKVEMADPAAAQRATGYLLGGISPLGQKKRLRTFIDESAKAFETIYVSAGRRGLEVELAPAVLAEHTQAKFAEIGRE